MAGLKEQIKTYLKVRDKVEPIVNEIRSKTKFIEDIPEGYEKCIIGRKIKILNNKDEYLNRKSTLEAAVNYYMENILSEPSIREVARMYRINHRRLAEEIECRETEGNKYQYDRKVKTGCHSFSYEEEKSLLETLKLQFTNTDEPCSCRTCFLLKLSTFAYEFAKSNNIACLSYWDFSKHADIVWLQEFEMRNSSEISNFCKETCTL